MTLRKRAVTSGYVALDAMRVGDAISHTVGGTAANVAANLAYLGWSSSIVARVGRDPAGRRTVNDLRTAGVDASMVERDSSVDSPVVIHEVGRNGHTFLFRCPQCLRKLPSHRPISEDLALRLAPSLTSVPVPQVFFFDRSSVAALRLAEVFAPLPTAVMFEPSAKGAPERTVRAAELADVLKASDERIGNLDANVFASRAGQLQIRTNGAAGLNFRIGRRRWRALPAYIADAVDAGGAGDWLTAAFLNRIRPSQLRDANAVEDALMHAQAIAALSCRIYGARGLAAADRTAVLRAAAALKRGHRTAPITAPSRARQSHARHACELCLGPA